MLRQSNSRPFAPEATIIPLDEIPAPFRFSLKEKAKDPNPNTPSSTLSGLELELNPALTF